MFIQFGVETVAKDRWGNSQRVLRYRTAESWEKDGLGQKDLLDHTVRIRAIKEADDTVEDLKKFLLSAKTTLGLKGDVGKFVVPEGRNVPSWLKHGYMVVYANQRPESPDPYELINTLAKIRS